MKIEEDIKNTVTVELKQEKILDDGEFFEKVQSIGGGCISDAYFGKSGKKADKEFLEGAEVRRRNKRNI